MQGSGSSLAYQHDPDEGAHGLHQLDPAEATPQQLEQRSRAGDVHDGRRERDAPGAEGVEGPVEEGVQGEVAESNRRRQPGRLQAEEGPVQQQHRPVEGEAGRKGGQSGRDHGRLLRPELAALVDQADNRLGQNCREDARRDEQKRDLPQAETDHVTEAVHVSTRREP